MTLIAKNTTIAFPHRHLLTCEGLAAGEINSILDLADKAADLGRQINKK